MAERGMSKKPHGSHTKHKYILCCFFCVEHVHRMKGKKRVGNFNLVSYVEIFTFQ
jgi:hypothetical protein